MRLGDTTSTIGAPSSGTWAGPRSGRSSTGAANTNTAVVATAGGTSAAPAVVVTAPPAKGSKVLLWVGLGLLALMVLKNHGKAA